MSGHSRLLAAAIRAKGGVGIFETEETHGVRK
jgi:hypothetical protein